MVREVPKKSKYEESYDIWIQPGFIRKRGDSCIESALVTLAHLFQLMEEVEHVHSECCRGMLLRCRCEPIETEELDMLGDVAIAKTVTDGDAVSMGHVKNNQIVRRGRVGARVDNAV